MGLIYKLEFASGKSYIGLTIQPLRTRLAQHRLDMRIKSKSFAVHRAWLKYGEPVISIVVEAEGEALKEAERRAIRDFDTIVPRGYNLSIGGDSPQMSEETRKKMSEFHRGRPKSAEHREKIGASQRGKFVSIETRQKMSVAWKTRAKASDQTRAKLSAVWKGRKQSAEHVARKAMACRHACALRNSTSLQGA